MVHLPEDGAGVEKKTKTRAYPKDTVSLEDYGYTVR